MAFAKGRAFVILNRMAESGNSEAKKILSNLNSMSQEDLDSKLSTLFGKGGASKEGDTAPKDEKGGKAPEGKEEAPKGTKEPKEGKVVANKDFDPNKEGVQSIFGTEEENAKSKDKQVFNTMEEVAKPKEKTAVDVIDEELDKRTPMQDKAFYAEADKARPKEMKSAKEGIKPVEIAPIQKTDAFGTSKEMGGGIGGGQKDLLGKKADLADPVGTAMKEMQEEAEDLMTMQGGSYIENLERLKEKYANDKNKVAGIDKAIADIGSEYKEDATPEDYGMTPNEKILNDLTVEAKAELGRTGVRDADKEREIDLINEELEEALMSGNPYEAVEQVAKKLENEIGDDGKRYLKKLMRSQWDVKDAAWTNPYYKKGSANDPMTSATEGIKPVEGGKPTETKVAQINKEGRNYKQFGETLGSELYYRFPVGRIPQIDKVRDKVVSEITDFIDNSGYVDEDEGDNDLELLAKIYVPYIGVAYMKNQAGGNPAKSFNDFIKTFSTSGINDTLTQSYGSKKLQKDDISYLSRVIKELKKRAN